VPFLIVDGSEKVIAFHHTTTTKKWICGAKDPSNNMAAINILHFFVQPYYSSG
jgi:hypothetical protein